MKRRFKKVNLAVIAMLLVCTMIASLFTSVNSVDAAENITVTFFDGKEVISQVSASEGSISLSSENVPIMEKDGYIFAGWYTSDKGSITDINAAAASAFDFDTAINASTNLYAGWIDLGVGANSDFYLEGVQYRTELPSGLRFIVKINLEVEQKLADLNSRNADIRPESNNDKGFGYGTVVSLKKNIPADGMLVKDESAKYVINGMTVVPAVNSYKFEGNVRYYTAVVKGITESYYDAEMAARPYITYYDANGNLQTYYYTEHGTSDNTYGGAYFTTLNKVIDEINKEEEPTTEEPTTEEPTTEYVEYGDPDVIVTDIFTTPAIPQAGDNVVFSAVVKNIGTASTPAGIITGVYFIVDGHGTGMWSDLYVSSIKPGESVLLKANGGNNGFSWNAASIGTYKVTATVDDVNRYRESNDYNNSYSTTFNVVEKSNIQFVTDPDTDEVCIDGFAEFGFAELLDAGLVSNDGSLRITSNGSISDVSGSATSTYNYEINPKLYYNRAVDKIIIDAVSVEGRGAVLNIYDGESEEPVLSKELPEASNVNNFKKSLMLDLSETGLSGAEKIRFEVVIANPSNDKDFELRSFRFMYAEIPTVYVNIDESLGSTIYEMNNSPDKSAECRGSVLISSPEGYVCQYTGKAGIDYSVDLEYLRGRGNSTWEAPKKPYKMKIPKTDLFGMGKSKHWCLLANFYDKSLMRNKLAYDLASSMQMPFTPQCVFVDLVMNDEYIGSYLLSEQIRVDKSRVEIDNLEDTPDAVDEETISGGYLLEITPPERVASDEVGFRANYIDKVIVFNSPSFEEGINYTQYNYMADYYHRMEEAVYSQSGYNSRGEYWTSLLDLDSAVNYYIMEEFFKNNDAMYASTRFYKPRADKLYMGPVWDFDLTAGTYRINGTENPEGWFVKNEYLFSALMSHADFRDAVKARYWEVRDNIVSLYADTNTFQSAINKYYNQIAYTTDLNFAKWGYGNNGWNNILGQGDWDNEVAYLRNWLQRRVAWMDSNINGL